MNHLSSLEIGEIVGERYQVEALLGQGGLGIVYRARQLTVGRKVALKMLLSHVLDEEGAVARFHREAEMAKRLEHPHTVRLYDLVTTAEGHLCIAFELLVGEALNDVIVKGALSVKRVARVGEGVLKSLMEAHSQGIVHRDIKPSNIFLCDFHGERDFVKVLDFGVAKSTKIDQEEGKVLTVAGQIIGTPQYMSPEQVNGGEIGPRADLYSLGLVMAEALTGQAVVQGDSSLLICFQHSSTSPLPVPASVLNSPLGAIILRATQKDPQRRFASAAEMLGALQAIAPSDLERAGFAVDAPTTPAGPSSQVQLSPTYVEEIGVAQPPERSPIGFAPTLAESSPPPPRQAQQSLAPFVGVIAVLALLVVLGGLLGGGILGAYLLVNVEPPPDTQADDETEPKPRRQSKHRPKAARKVHKKRAKPRPGQPVPLGDASVADLKRRLERNGWERVSETVTKSAGADTFSILSKKGSEHVQLVLMRYPTVATAKIVAKAYDDNESAAAVRDGGTVLVAFMVPANKKRGARLLRKLVVVP